MCGIVGYVGSRGAGEILLNSLKRLEYRGYDSAGIALLHDGEMSVVKTRGKVQRLWEMYERQCDDAVKRECRTGIAHTRWATHGAPTDVNAHPHLDQTGRIALVHNGIIENYRSLRRQLEEKGHTFVSETDTEVLVHMVGECYEGDLLGAVSAALSVVKGTFGIAVVCTAEPGRMVAARRGSPIVIGIGRDETLVASDAAAIISHTRRVIFLDDDDVALVTADGVDVRSVQNLPVTRRISEIEWDIEAAEKGAFEHFMLKEIFEQPEALANSTRGRLDDGLATAVLSGLALTPREIANVSRLIVVACGTSLHAGMIGEYYFEDLTGLPAEVEQAAEFRYRNPILNSGDMVLAISQSGETADTLAAVREAKQKGALVAGLCNVVASTIARETGRGVYLHAGPEIGVASTKAFSSQVAVLLMMALKFGRCRRLSRQAGADLCDEVRRLPEIAARVLRLNDLIAAIAAKHHQAQDAFYIGRGYMYPAALEGALKLKEISYVHAEGYHAAELKHGPIALLDRGVPVIALACDVPGKEKTLGNVQECRARGAPVIAVCTEGDGSVEAVADDVIPVPRTSVYTAPVAAVIALQLLAYHVARLRGCPIDQPRNLAKSVTVE